MRTLLLVLFACLSWAKVSAQDRLFLKDGSVLTGIIVEFHQDSLVKMEVRKSICTYSFAQIAKVEMMPQVTLLLHPRLQQHRQWYHHSTFQALPGLGQFDEFQVGLALQHVSGYQFNRWAGIGLGLGAQHLGGFFALPIFAEYRGYLRNSAAKIQPYYHLALGYNLALKRNNSNNWGWEEMDKARGGVYSQAALGLCFTNPGSGAHFTLDAGFNLHQAHYEYLRWDGSRTERNMLFRRSFVRLGVLF